MTTLSALLPLWLALRGLGLPAAPLPPLGTGTAQPPLSRPISRVTMREPEVAITFDACATKKGWYGFDRDVFDILKREQVPATIFVSGRWVDTHPEAMVDLTGDPLIEFGRQHGCRIVTLEVRRSNAAALRLYRRFAFRPVGVRPNYYAEDQEDAIVMLLDLS